MPPSREIESIDTSPGPSPATTYGPLTVSASQAHLPVVHRPTLDVLSMTAAQSIVDAKIDAKIVSGSAVLRSATASAHRDAERALNLPESVRSIGDYVCLLTRFYALYRPLEECLATFAEWSAWSISIGEAGHSRALFTDLAVLEASPRRIELAAPASLPRLTSFAQALGALYVLEGSKLGGRFILRDLEARLGAQLAGADSFLTGYGDGAVLAWAQFRHALDRYTLQNPAQLADVVLGAGATFRAIECWMSSALPPEQPSIERPSIAQPSIDRPSIEQPSIDQESRQQR